MEFLDFASALYIWETAHFLHRRTGTRKEKYDKIILLSPILVESIELGALIRYLQCGVSTVPRWLVHLFETLAIQVWTSLWTPPLLGNFED